MTTCMCKLADRYEMDPTWINSIDLVSKGKEASQNCLQLEISRQLSFNELIILSQSVLS